MTRALVLAIFVLSGAAGLVYEVVWARQLVLVFGNTTQAVSAILTGFFGGMAIGSAVGGRIADRIRRPLRLYGSLEVILVAVVLLTPTTFRLIGDVYRSAFGSLETAPGTLALVRFGLSLLALGPATVLMGATLPTLTRHLSRTPGHLPEAFGRLYAANTFGAILGAATAGFVLIELLGLSGTLLFGATCSGIAGVSALIIDWRLARGRRAGDGTSTGALAADATGVTTAGLSSGGSPLRGDGPTPGPASFDARSGSARSRLRIGLAVAYVSGLTSLGYQVLWTRLVASGSGNSTYVFTLILTVFLVGLAIGAVIFNLRRDRIRSTIGVLGFAQVSIALLVVVGMAFAIARHLTGPLTLTTSISDLFGTFFVETIVVVLPATVVMGISFPAASALVADPTGHTGSRAGLLLAVNTLGAITGTFLVPFVAIPALGSPGTLALLALVNAATGIALVLGTGAVDRLRRTMTALLGAGAIALVVAALVTGRVFVDPNIIRIEDSGGQVYASAEDEIASVQAGQAGFSLPQLWVTGTSMTLQTVDAKLMPILPLIARPDSKTALVVAFGMGSAFRSALTAGLETDVVELVPSVPKMAVWYYPDLADLPAVLRDHPGSRVLIADGRNHMELTDRHYDIIVTDPPPPIESSGVSVISSLEYYQAGKARLNPGGVMMQWIPYGQTVDEFKAHIRTFRSVFPEVTIAFGAGGFGFYMLGSEAPIAFDPAAISAVLARPGVLDDISGAYDSPYHDVAGWVAKIPSLVWISGAKVARFAGDGPLVSDDHPLPEYFLLRHLFGAPSPLVSPGLLLQLTANL